MKEIIVSLEKFGLTNLEAKIYLLLLENGKMNGYKVAKLLEVSRSSAYLGLHNLYKKNVIYLIPGESNTYYPEEPEVVIERIKEELEKTGDYIIELMKNSRFKTADNNFYNIFGLKNNIQKAKELIKNAREEIIISTEVNIWEYEKELKIAAEKGVRIIYFTWNYIDLKDLPIEEYYYTDIKEYSSKSEVIKTLLAVDNEVALMFGMEDLNEVVGTFSKNENLVLVVTDYISHDIYISKVAKKNGKPPITDEERIYTLRENIFFEKHTDK